MNDYSELKSVIAKNITEYRKIKGLTQADVAAALNYTDKAVSKWERGESIPDIVTLMQLADLYNVTINDLVTDEPKQKTRKGIKALLTRNKLIIPILSAGLVWLIATIVFVFLSIGKVPHAWLSFIYAVPISLIVFLVFNAIWGHKILSCVIVSALAWSIPVVVTLSLSFISSITISTTWMLYLIPVPLQILIILWYVMKSSKNK